MSYFDTALGIAGIGYTERSMVAVQLPEATVEATRRLFGRRLTGATDVDLGSDRSPHRPGCQSGATTTIRFAVGRDAVARIQALLAGEDVDLDPVPVDVTSSSDFNQQVYSVVRMIGRGETLTYGEVARRVGEPGERSGRRSGDGGRIRSRSSSPVIGLSGPTGSWSASRPTVGSRPSGGCCWPRSARRYRRPCSTSSSSLSPPLGAPRNRFSEAVAPGSTGRLWWPRPPTPSPRTRSGTPGGTAAHRFRRRSGTQSDRGRR